MLSSASDIDSACYILIVWMHLTGYEDVWEYSLLHNLAAEEGLQHRLLLCMASSFHFGLSQGICFKAPVKCRSKAQAFTLAWKLVSGSWRMCTKSCKLQLRKVLALLQPALCLCPLLLSPVAACRPFRARSFSSHPRVHAGCFVAFFEGVKLEIYNQVNTFPCRIAEQWRLLLCRA